MNSHIQDPYVMQMASLHKFKPGGAYKVPVFMDGTAVYADTQNPANDMLDLAVTEAEGNRTLVITSAHDSFTVYDPKEDPRASEEDGFGFEGTVERLAWSSLERTCWVLDRGVVRPVPRVLRGLMAIVANTKSVRQLG